MKTSIAIMIVMLALMPTVCGTSTITEVHWNANLKVIDILFDKFPAKWGGWTMYIDGKEWPMEGGPGKAVVRPNAAIGSATGLFVGREPWLSDLEKVNFPCCGTIQFSIPDEGYQEIERSTNTFQYDLAKEGCKTASPKSCDSGKKSPPPTDSFMAFRDIKLENNIDRPGMDFAHAEYSGLTLEQCAQDCLNVTSCKAFTYVMPGFGGTNSVPSCHLKSSVPDPVSKEGCVSGIATGIKLENNIDRPGMDFAHAAYSGLTLEQCAQGCLNVTSCKAFTFVMPGFGGTNSVPSCHLKNSVPDPVSKEGCVSGVKS